MSNFTRRILVLFYGNAGRLVLASPGAFDFDMAIIRDFSITESQTLQFRAEAFTVLNHPVFNNPINSTSNSRFGQNLSAEDSRTFQFTLKYNF